MAWAALGKGLMGAGRVVGGAARAAGGGARMARRMFKRKGGKNAPEKPASEQTVDVKATRVSKPSTALVPAAPTPITTSPSIQGGDNAEEIAIRIKTNLIDVQKLLKGSYSYREKARQQQKKQAEQDKKNAREQQVETKKFNAGNLLKKRSAVIDVP